ncbi:squalene/phytoene synthase family protein [Maricaulaceae bacterium NA33B04]|nr:squalene/phytoene synthase family protein [Maricaulaceae bacterium NA33B04]
MTDFDALLQKTDPDRRMAALFAPPELRGRLFTLYAFYHEIAKVPDTVSEAVVGEMRLAWARDAVADLFAEPPKVRRHDIYEALSELREAPGGPDRDTLTALVEARAADLGQGPFPTRDDRRDYVDRTAVTLMRAAARLLKPDLDLGGEPGAAIMAAGRLWGFVGLLRAFPALCEAGRPPFSADELAASELTEIDLAKGRRPEAVKAALTGLMKEAEDARAMLTRTRSSLPADVFPAVGYAGLASGYLQALKRVSDPYREVVDRPPASRQWRLTWASLTGRV